VRVKGVREGGRERRGEESGKEGRGEERRRSRKRGSEREEALAATEYDINVAASVRYSTMRRRRGEGREEGEGYSSVGVRRVAEILNKLLIELLRGSAVLS
jgi:hypothetical protein